MAIVVMGRAMIVMRKTWVGRVVFAVVAVMLVHGSCFRIGLGISSSFIVIECRVTFEVRMLVVVMMRVSNARSVAVLMVEKSIFLGSFIAKVAWIMTAIVARVVAVVTSVDSILTSLIFGS